MMKEKMCFVAYSQEYPVNCLTCPFCPAFPQLISCCRVAGVERCKCSQTSCSNIFKFAAAFQLPFVLLHTLINKIHVTFVSCGSTYIFQSKKHKKQYDNKRSLCLDIHIPILKRTTHPDATAWLRGGKCVRISSVHELETGCFPPWCQGSSSSTGSKIKRFANGPHWVLGLVDGGRCWCWKAVAQTHYQHRSAFYFWARSGESDKSALALPPTFRGTLVQQPKIICPCKTFMNIKETEKTQDQKCWASINHARSHY